MTRAQRLIIVWMAGALGSAVAYRVHALRAATSAAPSAVAPACAPPPMPPAEEPRAAITNYLNTRYDEVLRRDGRDVVVGLAYIGAPLVEVDSAPPRHSEPMPARPLGAGETPMRRSGVRGCCFGTS